MEHKCSAMQRECKQRETMQNTKQKEPECEYKCCEGDLCNTDPCSLGHSIRPPPRGIVGLTLLLLITVINFGL